MKALFWIGIVIVVLGLASFVVPLPHQETSGFSAGGMSVGIQTQHSETVKPIVSCILVLVGAGILVAARSAAKA
jgi:hypothetical protein